MRLLFLLGLAVGLCVPAAAQVVKLTTPDAAPAPDELFGAQFGSSVALDGDLILVGAPSHDGDGSLPGGNFGKAYVYRHENDTWVLEAELTASDKASGNFFGGPVALESSGNGTARALTNAGFGDNIPGGGKSALYVFERSLGAGGAVWTEAAKITVADPGPDEFLVRAVALSGERAIAGAFGAGGPMATGAAYVFRRDAVTGLWAEEARFTPPSGAADFARSVALSGDGDGALALVGAPEENEGPLRDTGAAYAYRYDAEADGGAGAWALEARLVAETPVEGDGFGAALALSGSASGSTAEGAAAVVGAVTTSFFGDVSGAAHVLRRAPGADGAWREEAKLTGSAVEAHDFFGHAVAFAGSVAGAAGDAAVVGAYGRSGAGGAVPAQGVAHVFRRDGAGAWAETARLRPTGEPEYERFGFAVAAQLGSEGLAVLAGAPSDTGAGLGAGAAYWFGPQAVAAEPGAAEPLEAGLSLSVFPNPFASSLTVAFVLAQPSEVRLAVYDVLGRTVGVLAEGWRPAGEHTARLPAGPLPAGVYVVRLAAGPQRAVQRVVLL